MYVKRISLENIRCFEDFDLEFERPGSSILLVGDNSTGKSTLLRSLAMGLCDQSSASALFRELPDDYVREGSRPKLGKIVVQLAAGRYRYEVVTEIRSLPGFERLEQTAHIRFDGGKQTTLKPDKFPWHRVFASAYGAGLRVLGTENYDRYLIADSLYSLFRYDTPLQNPELVMRRLEAKYRSKEGREPARDVLDELSALLSGLLDESDRVQLGDTGIEVSGEQGVRELGAVGDGYKATITWVLDLLGWWFLKRAKAKRGTGDPANLRGILLIDEIEQHLHPRWQRRIMELLSNSFPALQIIATSHSPLVASGCETMSVHQLQDGKHTAEKPYGWLAEDVYGWMGLPSSRVASFSENVLEEFIRLDAKRLRESLDASERAKLRGLKRQLDRLPQADSVRLSSELANIRASLKGLAGISRRDAKRQTS